MATITRYVDPDSSAGGNGTTTALSGANCAYVSLSVWEAARQGTFTDIERAVCCSNGASHTALSDPCTIDGSTTTSTCYHEITCEDALTPVWSTSIFRISISARHGFGIKANDDYVQIRGLQIECTSSGTEGSEYGVSIANTGCMISGCHIRWIGTLSGAGAYCESIPTGGALYMWNNLIIGFPYAIAYDHKYTTDTLSGCFYNNTVINGSVFIRFNTGNGSGFSLKNNIVQYPGGTDYNLANIGTTAKNISDDTSSPDTSYRSISLMFADASVGDYSLAETDTDAIGAGDVLSSDSILAFADDLIGTARGASWDIGAFEYEAALTFPPLFAHRQNTLLRR